uniref:Uncharacterized protein n=1 Tax=Pseudomonas phage HRDY3 TaxID=3236930 RepID=A0AB39CEJ0_9VIRU
MAKKKDERQQFLDQLKTATVDETLFRLCHKRGFIQGNYYSHRTRTTDPEDLLLVVSVFSHQHSLELPADMEVVGQHDDNVFIPMRVVRYERLMVGDSGGYWYLVKLQGDTSRWGRSM